MKKYIALAFMVLAIAAATMAAPVVQNSASFVASADTVYDTVIVNDTSYNYIYDTIVVPSDDTIFVTDTNFIHDTVPMDLVYFDVKVYATAHGKVAGNGRFPKGSVVELGAIPDREYRFLQWQNGETANPLKVVVNGNLIYSAIFDPVGLTPKSAFPQPDPADDPDTVVVYDTIPVVLDTHITIYYFDTTVVHDTIPFYVYDTVDLHDYMSMVVLSGDEEKGQVSGNGQFLNGTQVEIGAIPEVGNRFVWWHDRVRENPRKVSVDDTVVIFVAEFASDTAQGPSEPEDPNELYVPHVSIDCNGLSMTISSPANATIRIFTPNGRMLSQSDGVGTKHSCAVRPFVMPQSGVYLVQIANFPVRKVLLKEGYCHKL